SEEWAANTEFESHSTVSLQSTTELEAPAVSSSHDVTAKPTLPDELLTSVSSQPPQSQISKKGSGGSSESTRLFHQTVPYTRSRKSSSRAVTMLLHMDFAKRLEAERKTNIIQLIDYEVTDKCLLQEVMNGTMSSKDARVKDDGFIYMVLEYGEIDLARMLSQKWKEIEGSDGTIDENWLSLGPWRIPELLQHPFLAPPFPPEPRVSSSRSIQVLRHIATSWI
ncbi:hypothetical protein HID58_073495, partial [Brassica napus]